jgi:CRP-like cAMP-binding protein
MGCALRFVGDRDGGPFLSTSKDAMTHAPTVTDPLVDSRSNLTRHTSSEDAHGARRNRLLACLPEAVWQRWQPQLEAVDLRLGQVLCEPGERLTQVVFPTTAIVSLVYLTANGASAEIAVIGREGMVGTWLPMGAGSTPSREVASTAGRGFRLRTSVLLEDFNRSPAVMHLVLRYTQALLTQISQMAVCNRHHSLEERLCHWLLLRLDRLESSHIAVTQELIASMLGVRREGVTQAAGRLQKAGLITYRRGHIEVLDREGLEARSCECYRVVKNEYDRLLPPLSAS